MSLLELGVSGKVAVVTGAAQGIGAATARALAALGVKVALLDLESQRGLAAGVSSRRATSDRLPDNALLWLQVLRAL